MSYVEANVTVNIKDGDNIDVLIEALKRQLSEVNGLETHINIVEVDDPITTSPLTTR